MSLTKEAQHWHGVYEGLTQYETRIVDSAYNQVRTTLRHDSNFTPANDDRAEELVAAITKYYREGVK
jgi:hypothetical protein